MHSARLVVTAFCPTQIRSQCSSPPQDELLLPVAAVLLICLNNRLKGPPRRCLFFTRLSFDSGLVVVAFRMVLLCGPKELIVGTAGMK